MKKPKKPVNYISNKEMYQLLCDFFEAHKADPATPLPQPLAICFMRIAERLSTKKDFSRFSYRDEMVLDGFEECVRRVHSFNTKYTNPFAYFTQVIKNAFRRRIIEEQDEQYVRAKCYYQHQLLQTLTDNRYVPEQNEVVDNFISRYEERKKAKKVDKPKGLDHIFVDDDETT